MFPAEAAVLVELDPLRRFLLVLRRAVVPALAVAAGQMNDVSHGEILSSTVFGLRSSSCHDRTLETGDLFEYLGDGTRADRAAALANREARALLQRDRR